MSDPGHTHFDGASTSVPHFEELKFISEMHRRIHDQRRQVETRACFGTITVLVLIVGSVMNENVNFKSVTALTAYAVAFGCIVIGCLACLYLYRIHSANLANLCLAESAERGIVNGTGLSELQQATALLRNIRALRGRRHADLLRLIPLARLLPRIRRLTELSREEHEEYLKLKAALTLRGYYALLTEALGILVIACIAAVLVLVVWSA